MGLAEILALFSNLAKLGASPAIQQALTAWIAKQMGVAEEVLTAAIQASKDAPDPKG